MTPRLHQSGTYCRILNSHRKSGGGSLSCHSRPLTSHDSHVDRNYRHKSSKSSRDLHRSNHGETSEKSNRGGECDKIKGPEKESQPRNPDIDAIQLNNADATHLKGSVEDNSSLISAEVVPVKEAEQVQDKDPVEPTEVLIPGSTTAKVVVDLRKSNLPTEEIKMSKQKSGDRNKDSVSSNRKGEKEVTVLKEQGAEENQMASIALDTSDRQFAFMSTVEKTHEVSRLSEEIEKLTHQQAKLTHYIRQLKYIRSQQREEKRRLRRRLSALLLGEIPGCLPTQS